MAESILVTGKKISSMELVTNVQGNEKIPTGQPEDLAITPNQIKDFIIEQNGLVNQTELETEVSQLQTAITNTLNQSKSYTDTKVGVVSNVQDDHLNDQSNPHQVTKEQVGLGQVDNTSDIDKPVSDATRNLVDSNLNYIKENGAALPYSSIVEYIDRSVVIKDGELVQKNGNSWEKIKTETAYDLPTANSQNQQDVNDIVGAKWYAKEDGYAVDARVMLINGDIVRNTIANNRNDPNSDMTGWVNQNKHNSFTDRDASNAHPASSILDSSGKNQQELNSDFIEKLESIVSLKDFGAIGDGVTDDTVAVQSFVDYICSNHVHGFAPKGVYKLTSKINFTGTYGWGIIGSGAEATVFKQFTNNTPIFDLGAISGAGMHSYLLSDFKLDYNTSQPPSNTDSNPIRFSQMGYEGELNRITFARGSWAIKVVSGVGGPWGQHWDNLNFGGQLTGGAMDWTGAVNAVPNNYWGRFLVTCSNMIGPIFRNIRGYNWVWNALEMLDGKNAQWISMQAGSQCLLNSLKMELCTYSGEPVFDGNALMYFPAGQIDIGQLSIGGTYAKFEFTSGRVLFSVSSGSLTVKMLSTALTVLPTNFYMFSAISGNSEVNYRAKGSYPIEYTNVGGSTAAEYLNIMPDKNDKLSSNKGDADYTVLNGDPSQIRFETLLTAPRVVNLPTGNFCFNGLRYRVSSSGAVNNSNTIAIKASGNTKATLTADKSFIDLEWRRNATSHLGWVVIGSGVLP